MLIRRTIRPFLSASSFVVAIKLPDRVDVEPYELVTRELLKREHLIEIDDGVIVKEASELTADRWNLVSSSGTSAALWSSHTDEDEIPPTWLS